MIIPYVIIALASYFFLVDIKLVGSQTGLILIHTVLALPIVFIIVSNTLKGFDVSLEKAAMILGANKIKTFFRVTLPLIRTGIISAAFFSFLISFDELIIVLFIGGIRVVTLPRKMWEGVRMETDPTISAVATMLIVFSVFMLMLIWLIQYLSERRQKTND
jgi:putative spermidine/putrescine transport system permease protein